MPDISKLLASAGINLEGQAVSAFGTNTPSNERTIRETAINSVPNALPPSSPGKGRTWDPTPYSSAITSGAGNLDPRTKFLFNIEFVFDPSVMQVASSFGIDSLAVGKNLSFVVKQIDLPKFEFAHEEVNQYNFKTKILKQISHKELSFSFFDDVGNNALNLLNLYMKLMSPITRNVPSVDSNLNDYGMEFSSLYTTGIDTANRGVLPNNATQIIKQLKVHQIYIERSTTGNINDAVFFNTFTFTNPKIIAFDISDQDHESSNVVNILTASFDYDALNIATRQSAKDFNGNLNPAGDIFGTHWEDTVTNSNYKGQQISTAPPMDPYAVMDAKAKTFASFDTGSVNRLPVEIGYGNSTSSIIRNEVEKVIARGGGMSPLQGAIYRTMTGTGGMGQQINLPRVPYLTDNSASGQIVKQLSKKILGK